MHEQNTENESMELEEILSENKGKDYIDAEHILESRSGTSSSSIIPKGGIKHSENYGTHAEYRQLEEYYKATETVLSSWKVRKLANLGLAEWLPEMFVAKILIQGKFMQTKGFPHSGGFFALYPEEALFLLDVGDIELKYKEALLSLQDAFCLLLSDVRGGLLCTVDEYNVYAHLSRLGYRVQRYFLSSDSDSVSEDSASAAKREFQNDSEQLSRKETKKSKLSVMQTPVSHGCNTMDIAPEYSCIEERELSRNWWLILPENNIYHEQMDLSCQTTLNLSSEQSEHKPNLMSLSHAIVPNLAHAVTETIVLKQNKSLIPAGTSSDNFVVTDVWHQRLSKDGRNLTLPAKKIYSYPIDVDYHRICKNAINWTHYKSLIASERQEVSKNLNNLCRAMHSGKITPLVHPQFAFSNKAIHKRLKIVEETINLQNQSDSSVFTIRYNVFQTDRTKVFRKTQPGTPLLRVIVVNSNDPPPSLADISHFNSQSAGVPVKIALVNSGQIIFLAFDSFSIPTDIFEK